MIDRTLDELAASIRLREQSVTGLVAESLATLDEVADLNSHAWRDDDAVLSEAKDADLALARGEPTGPLHGVPISVKDWIDVAGFPCSGEDLEYRDRRPLRDASAVARLRKAGAIVIAKSNAGSLHGPARNPWDATRTAGHSSSGDAIAVATGASAVGIGSDSGGSLRFPAHCTGIATIKPTFGRVPATGHFPPVDALTDGRTVIGPLCRSAKDLRLVLSIIEGPDGIDPDVPPVSPVIAEAPRKLRIILHTDNDVTQSRDVAAMMRRVAQVLDDRGHHVTADNALEPDRALDLTQQYWDSLADNRRDSGRPLRLLEGWQAFKREAMEKMRSTDLIVSPAAPYPAPLLDGGSDTDWTYTLAASLWGFPAAVVRCGTSGDNLPLGVQVVARAWEETLATFLAETLEDALGTST